MKYFILMLLVAGSAFGQSMVLNQTNLYDRMRTGIKVVTNVPPVTGINYTNGMSNAVFSVAFPSTVTFDSPIYTNFFRVSISNDIVLSGEDLELDHDLVLPAGNYDVSGSLDSLFGSIPVSNQVMFTYCLMPQSVTGLRLLLTGTQLSDGFLLRVKIRADPPELPNVEYYDEVFTHSGIPTSSEKTNLLASAGISPVGMWVRPKRNYDLDKIQAGTIFPYVVSNCVRSAYLRMVYSNGLNRLFIVVGD